MAKKVEKPGEPEKPGHPVFTCVKPRGGVSRAYSNYTRISQTGFDLRIGFCEIIDVPAGKNEVVVEERSVITMSWLQAKMLASEIMTAVANFEKENGPVMRPVLTPIPEFTHASTENIHAKKDNGRLQ
jgi:hypothetical protein